MTAYELPLDRVPEDAVSFTFDDSLVTWDAANLAIARERGRPVHPRAGRLYRLAELVDLAADEDVAAHVEVQLWFDPSPEDVRALPLLPAEHRRSVPPPEAGTPPARR